MCWLFTFSVAIFLGIGEIQKLLRRRKNSKDKLKERENNRLAVQFELLLEAHKRVNTELNLLVQKYSGLKAAHGTLTQAYQGLIVHYESLERHYESLEREYANLEDLYNQLLLSHDNLKMEINRLHHQLQLAVAVIVGLVGLIFGSLFFKF